MTPRTRGEAKRRHLTTGAMIRSYFGEGRGKARRDKNQHRSIGLELSLKERVRALVANLEGASIESELELQEAGKRWLTNKTSHSFAKPQLGIGKTTKKKGDNSNKSGR